ncbi:uncharacterized protein LOC126998330 [Eriocheir sinensis]|uniref:uncharacterized protein LOC126998330 n=1 Tax=Eriocheir sinensis TaxID=95602 RepID=UPI0021C5EF23|nr:uncharacterized protein LOC126998330 [Eriocheir sinensis]
MPRYAFKQRIQILAAFTVLLAEEENEERERIRRRRKIWTRKWLKRRMEGSQYKNLFQELALEDEDGYRNWMRLDRRQFYEVLELIRPSISKQDTNMRAAVTAEERLAITMRHLVTGESQQSLSYQFRVSQPLISKIIPSVCTAIYEVLQPIYMRVPTTQEEWRKVAAEFHRLWNYPNCLGSCDGKRILVAKPANSGSGFLDYKGHSSIILMALVDANYKFLYVDVSTNGSVSDSEAWDKCTLKAVLENNDVQVPSPEKLPFSQRMTPFVIIADDAFPLKPWIMKPYPGKDLCMDKLIHNYRLSRAKRLSENAFGILVSRFQIFRQPIRTSPECVEKIALATTVLHNYLCVSSHQTYAPLELLDREDISNRKMVAGQWRDHTCGALENLHAQGRRPTQVAIYVRNTFCDYFNNEGKVPWQEDMVFMQ